jgi:hypothetical protein
MVDEASVWSKGRERLRPVFPIGKCDQEHGADEAARTKSYKSKAYRPRKSANQHEACEVGGKSSDQ